MKAYVQIVQEREREIGCDVLTHQKVRLSLLPRRRCRRAARSRLSCSSFAVVGRRLRRQPAQDGHGRHLVDCSHGRRRHRVAVQALSSSSSPLGPLPSLPVLPSRVLLALRRASSHCVHQLSRTNCSAFVNHLSARARKGVSESPFAVDFAGSSDDPARHRPPHACDETASHSCLIELINVVRLRATFPEPGLERRTSAFPNRVRGSLSRFPLDSLCVFLALTNSAPHAYCSLLNLRAANAPSRASHTRSTRPSPCARPRASHPRRFSPPGIHPHQPDVRPELPAKQPTPCSAVRLLQRWRSSPAPLRPSSSLRRRQRASGGASSLSFASPIRRH